jgi:hypothetical protein
VLSVPPAVSTTRAVTAPAAHDGPATCSTFYARALLLLLLNCDQHGQVATLHVLQGLCLQRCAHCRVACCDVSRAGVSLARLLWHVPVPAMVTLIASLLLERRVLVVGQSRDMVSAAVCAAQALLHPFRWGKQQGNSLCRCTPALIYGTPMPVVIIICWWPDGPSVPA